MAHSVPYFRKQVTVCVAIDFTRLFILSLVLKNTLCVEKRQFRILQLRAVHLFMYFDYVHAYNDVLPRQIIAEEYVENVNDLMMFLYATSSRERLPEILSRFRAENRC